MGKCKKYRALFVEALYNELTPEQENAFNAHINKCSTCAADSERMQSLLVTMKKRERKEPEPDFWTGYWDRLRDRLNVLEEKKGREPLRLPLSSIFQFIPEWARYGFAAMVLVGLGFFMGRLYPGHQYSIKNDMVQIPAPESVLVEKAAVNDQAMHYLERSKVLLLGLVNISETENLTGISLAPQKQLSQCLLDEANMLKENLSVTGQQRLLKLVEELEIILVQIANMESEFDLDAIELVQSGVDQKDIFLKINIEQMRYWDKKGQT